MKGKWKAGYRMRGRKNKREKEGHKEMVKEVQYVRRSDTTRRSAVVTGHDSMFSQDPIIDEGDLREKERKR
jgi:hypothetical protein